MKRIDVFFYGLFMDRAVLRAKGVDPGELRQAAVCGFELRIGKRATLVSSAGGRVHGMLASLTHADVERLYSDPSVSDYRPEGVVVDVAGGGTVAALCYNLVEPPLPEEHNAQYAGKLRSLAQQLGFPADYVASIR